jgi:hypothetical protein
MNLFDGHGEAEYEQVNADRLDNLTSKHFCPRQINLLGAKYIQQV